MWQVFQGSTHLITHAHISSHDQISKAPLNNNISISLRFTRSLKKQSLPTSRWCSHYFEEKTHKQRLNNWENRDKRRLTVNVLNQTQNPAVAQLWQLSARTMATVTPFLALSIFTAILGMFQFGFNTGVVNAPEVSQSKWGQ